MFRLAMASTFRLRVGLAWHRAVAAALTAALALGLAVAVLSLVAPAGARASTADRFVNNADAALREQVVLPGYNQSTLAVYSTRSNDTQVFHAEAGGPVAFEGFNRGPATGLAAGRNGAGSMALYFPILARAIVPRAPRPGALSGHVVNATNNQPLAGVTVAIAGTELSTTTDANGDYHFATVPGGSQQVSASLAGYVTSTQDVTIPSSATATLNFALSPALAAGEMRLVLQWGATPRDLDSHLWLPQAQPFHIWFGDKGNVDAFPFAQLDVDNTTGFGPETITLRQRVPGRYLYAIYNYSQEAEMGGSGAHITVYGQSGQLATYTVPGGSGRWWTVLALDGLTGAITPINTLNDTCPGYSCDGEH